MSDRAFPWAGDDSAVPCEGNRQHDVDPGRKEVRRRIEEAEQEARKSREIPTREGNPFRRWK